MMDEGPASSAPLLGQDRQATGAVVQSCKPQPGSPIFLASPDLMSKSRSYCFALAQATSLLSRAPSSSSAPTLQPPYLLSSTPKPLQLQPASSLVGNSRLVVIRW